MATAQTTGYWLSDIFHVAFASWFQLEAINCAEYVACLLREGYTSKEVLAFAQEEALAGKGLWIHKRARRRILSLSSVYRAQLNMPELLDGDPKSPSTAAVVETNTAASFHLERLKARIHRAAARDELGILMYDRPCALHRSYCCTTHMRRVELSRRRFDTTQA